MQRYDEDSLLPETAWEFSKSTFQAGSEAAIEAKLSELQALQLEKGKKMVTYSNGIGELFIELEIAGHGISEIQKKRALLHGLSKDLMSQWKQYWVVITGSKNVCQN